MMTMADVKAGWATAYSYVIRNSRIAVVVGVIIAIAALSYASY